VVVLATRRGIDLLNFKTFDHIPSGPV